MGKPNNQIEQTETWLQDSIVTRAKGINIAKDVIGEYTVGCMMNKLVTIV